MRITRRWSKPGTGANMNMEACKAKLYATIEDRTLLVFDRDITRETMRVAMSDSEVFDLAMSLLEMIPNSKITDPGAFVDAQDILKNTFTRA